MGKKIEINKELFKQQILDGLTITELMEQWNCSRTKITETKKKYGFVGLSPNSKPRDNGDGTKTCNICNQVKQVSEFYSNGYSPKGHKKLKASCKKCSTKKSYKDFVKRLISILHSQGREYKCEKCGYDDNYAALTFHHYTNEKNFEINSSRTRSTDDLDYEIYICKVLCQNCHHEIHNPTSKKEIIFDGGDIDSTGFTKQ
jgi:hypothetical protein